MTKETGPSGNFWEGLMAELHSDFRELHSDFPIEEVPAAPTSEEVRVNLTDLQSNFGVDDE